MLSYKTCSYGGVCLSLLGMLTLAAPLYAQTQVAGDNSVGTLVNNQLSTSCTNGVCSISGGMAAGTNLFHSFDRLSIQSGDEVRFENAGVDTIFSRVTGGASFIDGTISTATATPTDIFLLNPQGILFGANATLDVSGSFLASTADSVVFDNGAIFSARVPTQLDGLLRISTPVGLQYGTGAGGIEIQGPGHQLTLFSTFEFNRANRPDGLQFNSGETLALLGGPITFSGGNVTAPGGHVELASAGDNSIIGLQKISDTWEFDYTQTDTLQNIALSNASSVDVSDVDGGSVGVQAGNLSLVEGSVIVANVLGTGTGGGISVDADSILVRDRTAADVKSGLYSDVEFLGTGTGGDLNIKTQQLSVLNVGELSASTYWDGSAGNVNVQADQITMTGDSFLYSFGDFFASGNTGDVNVTANTIDLRDGAQIVTTNLGTGTTGIMQINAQHLFFQGVGADGFTQSGLESFGLSSDGGTIIVDANTIQLVDGGSIAANTFGSGTGGDIIIRADRLNAVGGTVDDEPSAVLSIVQPGVTGDGGNVVLIVDQLSLADGANVAVSTFGDGDAGNLTINSDTIDLAGTTATGRTAIGANAIAGNGDGGNIDIHANKVNIRDGATITVGNFQTVGALPPGQGSPGNINIVANGLALKNGGTIVADTLASENSLGNIVLDLDTLTLQQSSRISTNAQGSSTGGNITIDAIALIATTNSDISANAQQGLGGRIIVNARQILGTKFRPQLTLDSDITASSELGPSFSGSVELNTAYLEPAQGIDTLPITTVNPDQQVARQCSAEINSLVVSGRGGVADSPSQSLRPNNIWTDQRLSSSRTLPEDDPLSEPELEANNIGLVQTGLNFSVANRLTEAQKFISENGQVKFITSTLSIPSPLTLVTCDAAQSTSI